MFFFSLTAHCCFIAILKNSAETNAGQSHRLTHCIKNLHCYNLKSLIFTFHKYDKTFEDLFFVSQSLTNAISLPLIYSNSSEDVSDFSARKRKKEKKPDISGSIFPTTPRQRSNPHAREGLANQIPHSPSTEDGQMPGVCPGGGGRDVEVSI